MSISTNLYQINGLAFSELQKNHENYQIAFDEDNSSVFEQNFEGLQFLFARYYSENLPDEINLLFNPVDVIGEEVDYSAINWDDIDGFPESSAIYYVKPSDIEKIFRTLQKIDKAGLLGFYNAEEFNQNDIYPGVWHTDESSDKAFNKGHLSEGFDLLYKTISKAAKNNNYILYFTG